MSEVPNNAIGINDGGARGDGVRICTICGSPNANDDTNYCSNCWLRLDRPAMLSEQQAVTRLLQRRSRWLKHRSLILAGVVVLALVLWQAFQAFDVYYLLTPAPKAAGSVGADAGPGAWGQAGGNATNSSYILEEAPAPDRVAWTFEVPGAMSQPAPPRFLSSPVVSGGRVYLTTEDGRAVALEQGTGEVIWQYDIGLPGTASPAIAGELVIFGVRPGNLYALDKDSGGLRWFTNLKAAIVAAPVVEHGRVYIGTADHSLYALDADTGEQLWRFTASAWVISPAAYADDTLVVTTSGSIVHVLDAKDGRERFIYDTGRIRNLYGSAAILGDSAFVPSHRGALTSIDRGLITQPLERKFWGARVKFAVWWSLFSPPVQKGTQWISSLGGRIVGSPAAAHEMVFSSVKDGRVVALDAGTGAMAWETDLGRRITTSPTVAGYTVLVGTWDGLLVGLDAGSGEVKWQFQAGDSEITSRPIVSDGLILAPSKDGNLYALAEGGR